MEIKSLLTSFSALIFVLGLIWLVAIFLRKYGSGKLPVIAKGKSKRISVIDALVIDARRKIILIRCDDKEHLILLGPEKELVIDTKPAENEQKE